MSAAVETLRSAVGRRGPSLTESLTALREALEAADGHLPAEMVHPARVVLSKAGARIALGDATVVALAGATGSGKSTLFNALAGEEVSRPGVKRPTTGTAHAVVWGGDPLGPTPLLDWLGVPRRHVSSDPDPALAGLILLDLPDHDSTRLENRLEVDRLVELVDVLVWVLDPQKYADAAVHDRYLAPYADHAGVLLVVLNQSDRLSPEALEACRLDLRGLLDREGLADVPIAVASGRTGDGVPGLRAELGRRVAARRAASDRLAADVRTAATALDEHCGGTSTDDVGKGDRRAVVDALSEAAGVPVVARAVERSMASRATAATGWPLLRWVGRLRPDPLRRLHLAGGADERVRTSLTAPTGVQTAQVSSALRRARDAAGSGMPDVWRDRLRARLEAGEGDLPDQLDKAVAGTDLGAERTPAWWSAVGVLHYLLLACALAGGLWLLGLVGLSYLQLSEVVPLPTVRGFPLPTLLLVGGLLAGLLLAALIRPFTRMTARRRGRRAAGRLRSRVEEVADAQVLAPMAEEREAYTRFCAAVQRARA